MKIDEEKYEVIVSFCGGEVEWIKFGDEIKYFDRPLNNKQKDDKTDEPFWINLDLKNIGKNSEN